MQNVQHNTSGSALAGFAILLEIGAEYGVIELLQSLESVNAKEISQQCGINASVISTYLDSLCLVGLIEIAQENPITTYRACNHFEDVINEVGYLSWALRACAPLIDNARQFAENNEQAQQKYPRSGSLVARTSKWMGGKSFYPHPENAICALSPQKLVDLGSGSGEFLIRMLRKIPQATGVGIDLSTSATQQAQNAAQISGESHRLEFITAPIQTLVHDPSLLDGADVIHAGFVLHDLIPTEVETLDALLLTCRTHAPQGTLVIVDAIPFAQSEWERPFAVAFNYLHNHFMSRMLLSEKAWTQKLNQAGYSQVSIAVLDHPGGRMFIASK